MRTEKTAARKVGEKLEFGFPAFEWTIVAVTAEGYVIQRQRELYGAEDEKGNVIWGKVSGTETVTETAPFQLVD